jgi:cyclopropane fatty-acyl-phospholipid synthase-like methyltransferase
MNENIEYWNSVQREIFACPNLCLFRFMGDVGINIKGKNVLELGFGMGSDLIEMQKRGANAYGIDIDKRKVGDVNKLKGDNEFPIVFCGDIVSDIKEFNISFDFVSSQDTLYYLEEEELLQCLNNVKESLAEGGKLLFQIITGDYRIVDGEEVFDSKAIIKNPGNKILFRDENFYVSCLEKSGFKVIAKKIVKETFSSNCDVVRHNLYLCCSKLD